MKISKPQCKTNTHRLAIQSSLLIMFFEGFMSSTYCNIYTFRGYYMTCYRYQTFRLSVSDEHNELQSLLVLLMTCYDKNKNIAILIPKIKCEMFMPWVSTAAQFQTRVKWFCLNNAWLAADWQFRQGECWTQVCIM